MVFRIIARRRARPLIPAVLAAVGLAAVGLTAGACTIDNHGLLAANVTPASGAVVVDIYSLGGTVRTMSVDSGASLGYSHRSYIYPASARDLPQPGWHLLSVPLPPTRPVAFKAESIGLEAGNAAGELSGSIGYQSVTVMAAVTDSESVAYRLDYAPDDPAATVLTHCEGMPGC